MIWFGFEFFRKVLIVVLVCFFPITVGFVQGLTSTEPELDELLQVMRATPSQILWKVRGPKAMPQFFSGLKIAAAYSVTGAVLFRMGWSAGRPPDFSNQVNENIQNSSLVC